MRRGLISCVALCLVPAAASAQTTYFEDDFDCSDESSFGEPAGAFG